MSSQGDNNGMPEQVQQRPKARQTHGLTAPMDPPALPVAMALADKGELVAQVDALFGAAVWIANELSASAVLSRGERLVMIYADIAGRCVASADTIRGGGSVYRYKQAQDAAGQLVDRQRSIERQAVIVGLLAAKTRGAFNWLKANGATKDGEPRKVLHYYGEYLERTRRNCVALAAMLPDSGDDAADVAALIARYRVVEGGADGHS